jgi:hypothetical protein
VSRNKGAGMNLERFYTIIATAVQDMKDSTIQAMLQQMCNDLQNQMNEPGNANYQTAVSETRAALVAALADAASVNYSPSWLATLDEFELHYLNASFLSNMVEEAFSGNEAIIQTALQKLKNISGILDKDIEICSQLILSFTHLNVDRDELGEGECEISVTIPRKHVNSEAIALSDEIAAAAKLLKPFPLIVSGKVKDFNVRSIASTDYVIVFEIAAEIYVAARATRAIADALSAIIRTYKEVASLRSIKSDVKGMDLDDDAKDKLIENITETVEKTVKNQIQKNAIKIFDDYNVIEDAGVSNEMKTYISKNMYELATRIDNGFDFETRMGALPEPLAGIVYLT